MAVIRSTKQQQQQQPYSLLRLLYIGVITILILFLIVLLYQIDAGFRLVRNEHMTKRTTTTTGGTTNKKNIIDHSYNHKPLLLKQQQQQQQHKIVKKLRHEEEKQQPTINHAATTTKTTINSSRRNAVGVVEHGPISDETIQKQQQQQRQYYLIVIANLVDTTTTSNNTTTSTSTGSIILETRPDWGPIGVQQLHTLLKQQFYVNCRFFRVVPNFIVQFGIHGDPKIQKEYRTNHIIRDEEFVTSSIQSNRIRQTNSYGTISYAMSGKDTRTTQLFINTRHVGNTYLDSQGFTPVATILYGMNETIQSIQSQYKELPNQNKIQQRGNEYLNNEFPNLSYIQSIEQLFDYKDAQSRIQQLMLRRQQRRTLSLSSSTS